MNRPSAETSFKPSIRVSKLDIGQTEDNYRESDANLPSTIHKSLERVNEKRKTSSIKPLRSSYMSNQKARMPSEIHKV